MKNGRPNLVDFRDYNREQLLGWLAANVGGGLMREGTGIRRIDKRDKPGARVPLTEEMLDALEDPDVQLTDKIIAAWAGARPDRAVGSAQRSGGR